MKKRNATDEEVMNYLKYFIGRRHSFRHFATERCNRHGSYIVQYASKKLIDDNGKVAVMHDGRLQHLTGTYCELKGSKGFVTDIRIKSEYLPSNI